MKIRVLTPKKEDVEKLGLYRYIEIEVDGSRDLSFLEGEPEDATFERDLSDCKRIPEILKKAYEAGVRREGLIIEEWEE